MAFFPTPETRWHPQTDTGALKASAVRFILACARRSIQTRGVFHIVLSGGNTPRPVYESLRESRADWRAWRVWFGDERCLPSADPERNSRMALDALFAHVPLPQRYFYAISAERGALNGAFAYAKLLQDVPEFDLVLLGLGEDGHTASLFPGGDTGGAFNAQAALPIFNAPKPPPERVTLSAARLSLTRQALFLVSGESKRAAVARWRAGENIPAARIAPRSGVDIMFDAALVRHPAGGGPAASAS
ncbi:MAG: 6-phosphogluconolactonase [Betaproteobacteria bacterium]|nr:6-phosphogluconolactonase [Betaproteobacteria bacterium]